jgi:hypothetical protein
LPGFAGPQPAPEEPLIEIGRRVKELREQRWRQMQREPVAGLER